MKSKTLRSLALILSLTIADAAAQNETELVQQQSKAGMIEEYYVLKADKTVRQGRYIRYHMSGPLAGAAVYEVGSYDHGRKEGEWRYFSEQHSWNRMVSKGTYRAGLPEGQWYYYHHNPLPAPLRKVALNQAHPENAFTVATEDTTAVVQAKGFCIKGERAGLWRYYDASGTLIQAINHSTKQLLYYLSNEGKALSGAAASTNHPLLYVGGKAQLKRDVAGGLSPLLNESKVGSTGVTFSVDSTGKQIDIRLTSKAAPDRYERLVLAELNKLPTRWLPRVVDGRPIAATYYVVISTVLINDKKEITVEPFSS